MRFRIVCAAAAAMLASAGAAYADSDWIATVGVRTRLKPAFDGAAGMRLDPLPLFTFRRADKPFRFTPPSVGASFSLFDTTHLVVGPVLRFRYKRDNVGKYAGLAPVSKVLMPGAFVEYWPEQWFRARVEARDSLSGRTGWNGEADLDLIHTGARWSASIGPRLGVGDSRYNLTYFGVTPQEAAQGPLYRTPYIPGGGVRYTGVTAAASYRVTPRWTTTADVSYERLASIPMASPIIRAVGSGDQVSLGVSLSYSFGIF